MNLSQIAKASARLYSTVTCIIYILCNVYKKTLSFCLYLQSKLLLVYKQLFFTIDQMDFNSHVRVGFFLCLTFILLHVITLPKNVNETPSTLHTLENEELILIKSSSFAYEGCILDVRAKSSTTREYPPQI